jgi:hypothetical protein
MVDDGQPLSRSRTQGCWNPHDPHSDRRFSDERLQTPTIRYNYISLKLCIQEFSRNASEPLMWALRSTLSFFTDSDGDISYFQGPDSIMPPFHSGTCVSSDQSHR